MQHTVKCDIDRDKATTEQNFCLPTQRQKIPSIIC